MNLTMLCVLKIIHDHLFIKAPQSESTIKNHDLKVIIYSILHHLHFVIVFSGWIFNSKYNLYKELYVYYEKSSMVTKILKVMN